MAAQKISVAFCARAVALGLLFLSTQGFAERPAVAGTVAPTAAAPQEKSTLAEWEFGVGVFNHGLESFDSQTKEGGLDINLELQSPPLLKDKWGNEYFRWQLGATLSLLNKTHIFYTGFAFELNKPIAPFFISIGLGMAVHTGKLGSNDEGFNALGCRWAFHENAAIGIEFLQHHRLMLTIEHISNARALLRACPHNAGLSNIGGRYSYRF